eukprot:GHVN01049565.1.p1 GENE.GHVN01049565.1~~GHVN01049565.1.p1  ORF type:complete len:162 (-),score=45.45 GHVN01049565.1:66-551(-)
MPFLDSSNFLNQLHSLFDSSRPRVESHSRQTDTEGDSTGTDTGSRNTGTTKKNSKDKNTQLKKGVKEGRGSVWLTLKRHYPTLPTAPRHKRKAAEALPDMRPVCIMRATNGKKKISCQVSNSETTRVGIGLCNCLNLALNEAVEERKQMATEGGGSAGAAS